MNRLTTSLCQSQVVLCLTTSTCPSQILLCNTVCLLRSIQLTSTPSTSKSLTPFALTLLTMNINWYIINKNQGRDYILHWRKRNNLNINLSLLLHCYSTSNFVKHWSYKNHNSLSVNFGNRMKFTILKHGYLLQLIVNFNMQEINVSQPRGILNSGASCCYVNMMSLNRVLLNAVSDILLAPCDHDASGSHLFPPS